MGKAVGHIKLIYIINGTGRSSLYCLRLNKDKLKNNCIRQSMNPENMANLTPDITPTWRLQVQNDKNYTILSLVELKTKDGV